MRRDREEILAGIEGRRDRHRSRPLVVRALVMVAGAILMVPGMILTVVFPEAGIPLLVIALRLLALEFDWAVRALGWVVLQWEGLRAWFARRSRTAHLMMALVAVTVGGFITALLV